MGEEVEELPPCGVPLIGSNCQKHAMEREIRYLRSSMLEAIALIRALDGPRACFKLEQALLSRDNQS